MLNGDQNELITMAEAARLLPGRPSVVSLWRWRLRGIAGVKLRFVTVGRKPLVTREWLREFIIKSSEARQAKNEQHELHELGWDQDILAADAIA